MPGINLFNIALFSSSLLVCITSLLFTYVQRRTDKLQNKVYIVLLCIVALNASSCIAITLAEPFKDTSNIARDVLNVFQYLYFLLHTALCPLFFYYVSCVCGAAEKLKFRQNIFYSSIFLITESLVLVNPFFHIVYYFDEEYIFHRSLGETAIYLAAAAYLALSIGMLLFSWEALTSRKKIALIYFFCIVIAGVLLQLFFMNVKIELFAESIALMGVMLAIESEDDRIDIDTGFYNRKALQNDINSYVINKRRLHIICIKITNGDIIEKATGSGNIDILSNMVSDFFKTIAPRYHIYNTSPGTFVITVFDKTEEEALETAGRISRRFDSPWLCGDTEIPLSAVVMAADFPERIKNAYDTFYMTDSPIPPKNDKKILSGSDLDYLLRRAAVEGAVSRGLEENNFEVYYQPTYYTQDRKLHGAEALIRLHDGVIGNVFPDEFIPIAEQIGLIDEIDDFVLREVCKFLISGVPAKNGMDCINVNLSVLQCMRPGFVAHINAIAEEYSVDKSMINFEITESVAASDYKLLSSVVSALKSDGFRFSMDDYGTGYSNMQSIFSLDFDVVKIDKSILWSAEQSELGRIILENSVHMIQQMHREILVEGVETESQIDMLTELSVDYLQGYYFSRPIPKDDFIAFIENN